MPFSKKEQSVRLGADGAVRLESVRLGSEDGERRTESDPDLKWNIELKIFISKNEVLRETEPSDKDPPSVPKTCH